MKKFLRQFPFSFINCEEFPPKHVQGFAIVSPLIHSNVNMCQKTFLSFHSTVFNVFTFVSAAAIFLLFLNVSCMDPSSMSFSLSFTLASLLAVCLSVLFDFMCTFIYIFVVHFHVSHKQGVLVGANVGKLLDFKWLCKLAFDMILFWNKNIIIWRKLFLYVRC